MSKDSFENGDGQINKSVPPIIQDEEKAASISSTTETGGQSMNIMSSSNFAVSLILGASMQQLWGMIRALQMVILSALIRIPVPSHAFLFF